MSTPDTQRKRKWNCDLDLETLECPICFEPFSLPIFQCPKGHLTCSGCCKKLFWECHSCQLRIGTRCIPIEKVVESLQVSCKYASHGCEETLKLTAREEHEEECGFAPNLHCPVPGCTHRGTKFTLPVHLKEEHSVRTVELNVISRTVGIRMEPSERLVMVEGIIQKEMFLVHRDGKSEFQGDIFFCTSFGPSNSNYELKVSLSYTDRRSYSMANRIVDIRYVEDLEKEQDFLIFPSRRHGVPIGCGLDILLGVFPVVPIAEEDRD